MPYPVQKFTDRIFVIALGWRAAKTAQLIPRVDDLPAISAGVSFQRCPAFRAPGKFERYPFPANGTG